MQPSVKPPTPKHHRGHTARAVRRFATIGTAVLTAGLLTFASIGERHSHANDARECPTLISGIMPSKCTAIKGCKINVRKNDLLVKIINSFDAKCNNAFIFEVFVAKIDERGVELKYCTDSDFGKITGSP